MAAIYVVHRWSKVGRRDILGGAAPENLQQGVSRFVRSFLSSKLLFVVRSFRPFFILYDSTTIHYAIL